MGLLSRIEDIGGGLLGLSPGASAQQPPAAAQPQGPQPYKPGFLDTLGEVLFNGMAPADAGAHLRQLHYQTQMMQAMPGLINSLINPDATPSVQPGAVQPATAPQQDGATMQPASAPMGVPAQSGPVGPGGLSLSNPRVQRTLVAGTLTGLIPNADKVVQVLQAAQPDVAYDRGYGYDKKTGRAVGGFHPEVGSGQIPLYGPDGQFYGVANANGAVQAAADLKRAEAGAEEAGKAPWTLVDVPQSDGSTRKMPLSIAAPLLSRGVGAGAGGSSAGGTDGGGAAFGVTQSPAAQTLANKRAENQASNEQLQPKEYAALQGLDSTSSLTSKIIHQILGDTQDPKTGQWVPGGKGAIHWNTVGGLGEALSHVPGMPAYDLDQQLEHIKAMTSMDELQKLRDNSPTGAGLGRVTQQEINLLAAMRGSLDQGQSGPQFTQNLRNQLAQLDATQSQRHQLYESQFGNVQRPTPGSTAPIPPHNAQMPSREALLAEARRRGLIK